MGVLTRKLPKPLIKVRGKTFLEHIFSALPSTIGEVIVVVGYKGGQIRKFLGSNFGGKRVSYVENAHIALGNAHSLVLTRRRFRRLERFMLMYADELPSKREVTRCLATRFSWLTVLVTAREKAGVVTLSRTGRVIAVEEKPEHPTSDLVPGGVMVVNTDIFNGRPRRHRNGEYTVTSLMAQFIKTHVVKAVSGRKNLYFSTRADVDRFNTNGRVV